MKRIFSLTVALIAACVFSFAEVHTFKVTSSAKKGSGTLSDIVSQINELPETDEAIVTFQLPSSAKNTVHAADTQLVFSRIVSIRGGSQRTTIEIKELAAPYAMVREVSNIDFVGDDYSQALYFNDSIGTVSNCSFTGYDTGIRALKAAGKIHKCDFKEIKSYGIFMYGNINTIDSCSFSDTKIAIGHYPASSATTNSIGGKITACSFTNCSTPIELRMIDFKELSNCTATDGNIGIYSSTTKFVNNKFKNVNFTNATIDNFGKSQIESLSFTGSSVKDLGNLQIEKLSLTGTSVEKMSKVTVENTLSMSSSGISTLEQSRLKSGITGNCTELRLVNDTITNDNGYGIQLSGSVNLIDNCLIYNCKNAINNTSIDSIISTEIKDCTGDGINNTGYSINYMSDCNIHDCLSGINGNSLGKIESSQIHGNREHGITSASTNTIKSIDNCKIYENGATGITSRYSTDLISNCEIKDNLIGIEVDYGTVHRIDGCRILDNKKYGIHAQTSVTVDSISNCILSGSDTAVNIGRATLLITECVIGKDGVDPTLKGNKTGIYMNNMAAITVENSIISGNEQYGIDMTGKPNVTLSNNYIGTNASLAELGNGVGVYVDKNANETLEMRRNILAYNEIGLWIQGTEANDLSNNKFIGNKQSGYKLEMAVQSSFEKNYTSNLYLNTPAGAKAMDNSSYRNAIATPPTITNVSLPENGYVNVSGKLDYDRKARIYVYATDGNNQNAIEYMGADSTDADGNFEVRLRIRNGAPKGYAVFASAVKDEYISEFSDSYNYNLSGNFYVKTVSEGTGDGSKWENAMDSIHFAQILPLVEDGTTFYVAEGTYKPMYNYRMETPSSNPKEATFFVQSNVTINGGYSKDAKTGAVADPSQYKTIFSGDIEGNNKMVIDTLVTNTDSEGKSRYSFDWYGGNTDDDAGAIFSLAQSTEGIYYNTSYGSIYPSSSPVQDNGKQKYFNLNGVYLDGGGIGIKSINPNINITIENTKFANLGGQPTYLLESPATVKVNNCTYNKCGFFEIFGADSIVFSNTKISEGMGCILSKATEDKDVTYIFEDFEYTNSFNRIEINGSTTTQRTSYLSLKNCKIENNYALSEILFAVDLDVVAKNCLFKGNQVTPFYVYGKHAHLENCDFVENKMDDDYCIYLGGSSGGEYQKPILSNTTLKNCTFQSNECQVLGQLPYTGNSKDSIINCTIEDNKLTELMFFANDPIVFENSTIKNNEMGHRGIINFSMGLHLNNSLLEGNKVKGTEEDVNTYAIYTHELHVKNSTIKGNEMDSIFFMVNHTAEFTNDTITDNSTKMMVYGFDQGLDVTRCSFKGNEGGLFYCQNTDQETRARMRIWNSDFTGNNIPSDDDLIHLYGKDNDEIIISETNFNNNSAHTLMDIHDGNTTIFKCDFFGNKISGEFIHLPEVTSLIEASTFRQNELTGGNLIYTPYGELTLYNNTIASNKLKNGLFSVYPSAANVYIYNNTIIANETTATSLVGGSLRNYALIGNIIGDVLSRGFDEDSIWYNVFVRSERASIPDDVLAKNIFTDDITSLFNGTVDESTGIFTPELKIYEGSTPIAALKSDALPDGTVIRFPLKETVVYTDQRDMDRLDSTCMGAFEINCTPDTTLTNDTIYVGDKFLDIVYTTVGRHDIVEKIPGTDGCSSVALHTLYVKPDSTVKNYYVKMDRWGTGDGSTWDNAMDSVDFATYLSLAPDGATFYVAEGTYKPVYDYNLAKTNDHSQLTYLINSNITIKGGYSNEATANDATSDYTKYHTIFSGDLGDDDYLKDSTFIDGRAIFVNKNTEDNVDTLFRMDSKKIAFDGIMFKSAKDVLNVDNQADSVTFSKCTFDQDNILVSSTSSQDNISLAFFDSKITHCQNEYLIPISCNIKFVRTDVIENTFKLFTMELDRVDFENVNITGNVGELIIMTVHTSLSFKHVKINDNSFYKYGDVTRLRGVINCHEESKIDSCQFSQNHIFHANVYWTSIKDSKHTGIIEFSDKGYISNSTFDGNEGGAAIWNNANDTIRIERTTFKNNKNVDLISEYQTGAYYQVTYDRNPHTSVNKCVFTNNSNCKIAELYYNNSISLTNSTIYDNKTTDTLFTLTNSNIHIENNTIIGNEANKLLSSNQKSVVKMYNNTITGNTLNGDYVMNIDSSSILQGNILLGNKMTKDGVLETIKLEDTKNIVVENNIIPLFSTNDGNGCLSIPSEKNIVSAYYTDYLATLSCEEDFSGVKNRNEELFDLMAGTYDPTTGIFTPELKTGEDFTPVVMLKSDRLPDGTSIRFPLTETVVTTDQRGETRLDPTCMGAYEIKCSAVKSTVTDTVTIGDPYSFNGNDLSTLTAKVGVHTFTDTIKLESGCDSIVTLALAVRPEKKDGGYYVKVDGTGDGSDWLNAMSPTDFATYLPLVYDDDTFHVAAGTYHCDVEDPLYGLTYIINKSVTIIGGYPDTVTTIGTPSVPEAYTTKLSADTWDNDNMYFYTNEYLPTNGHFGDNEPTLIHIMGQPHVSLFGITFSGVNNTEDGAISLKEGAALAMDRCVVTKNLSSAIYAKDADIKVTNSEFSLNFSCVGSVFNVTNTKLDVNASTIHENFSHDTICKNGGAKGAVAYLDQSSAVFVNNTIVKNRAFEGAVFVSQSSELDLTNNTIAGNFIEPKSTHTGSVFTFTDESSKMKLFGNMIVANGKSSMEGNATITSSDYNIFSSDFTTAKGEHDMAMKNTDVPYILDGEEYYGNDDIYLPTTRDNGGYTPTVALFQSLFDGGAVLSIPAEARAVDFDQRGYLRKDTSCVGAFEFPTYVDYYVKTRSHGDGSGKDWDNAMGDTTFARYFSIVPKDATFHIAAGTYHPMFDWTGKISNSSGVAYTTSRPINVIGAYPPNAKEGDVPDATKYATILSADLTEDDVYTPSSEDYINWDVKGLNNNASRVMDLQMKQSGSCHLYGLTMKGNYPMFKGSSAALSLYSANNSVKASFYLDSCSFVKTYVAIYSGADTLCLKSCRFDTILYADVCQTSNSDKKVYNEFLLDGCSFSNTSYGCSFYAPYGRVRIQNSTFNSVRNPLSVFPRWVNDPDMHVELYNNTFSLNRGYTNAIELADYAKTVMKGNVFNMNFRFVNDDGKEVIPVVSDYNLYVYNPDTTGNICQLGEHDLLVEPKDLVGIFEGSLKDDKFFAVDKLASKENITTIIEVLEDKLPNGSFIRLPLEETVVTIDETGRDRNALTCMGAYEMDCRPDTLVMMDTIQIGGSFQGITYDTVGNYKIYGPDSVNVIGCPMTIEHHLYVTPSFDGSGFYVKTERTGRGTGADWDNAMNGADFLYGLPIVEDGATFYVAEGSYAMDKLSGATSVTTENSVTIIGGFKKNAKKDDEKNAAYVTRFYADSIFNLNIEGWSASPVGLYDVRMSSIQYNVKGQREVVVDSCSFDTFDIAINMDSTKTLLVNATSFDAKGRSAVGILADYLSSVSVENSTFTGILSNEENAGYAIHSKNTLGDVVIKNTTFADNNTATPIAIDHLSGKSYLYNNTIAGNNKEECTLSLGEAVMRGNIFTGNASSKLSANSTVDHAYNVYPSTADFASDLDVKLPIEQLPLYLDGTYDANTGLFTANLKDNGGFVKTVALMKDSFPDHSLARFPIENTTVKLDARGVARLDLSCYGAYELFDGVRDTVSIAIYDTVCLGTNYEKHGWNVETSQLEADATHFDTVFAKGVISTDTLYTLELKVVPFQTLRLDSVAVSPTKCHGSGSGEIYFATSCHMVGAMSVTLTGEGEVGTILSQSYPLTEEKIISDLKIGTYTMTFAPISQCVNSNIQDVVLEVKDRESLHTANAADTTLYTSCANSPSAELTIPMDGFHPSMKIYFDGELISSEANNANAYVDYKDDAAFTAKGEVILSAIAVGEHDVKAEDDCGNAFDIKHFTVDVPESDAIEMQLVDYTTDSLKCGLDFAFANIKVKSGVATTFTLKSDKGYEVNTTLTSSCDSTFSFNDLPAGDYQATFKKYDPACSDSVFASFSIYSPEPLSTSLTSNGAACAEGAVTVDAKGGRGKYIYHWTDPRGEQFDSTSNHLNDVSAGNYICVVEDSTGCLSHPDTLSIIPNVDQLSELKVDSVYTKNITCFDKNNGTIGVLFSTDNTQQSVACVVTNTKTKEETKAAGTYAALNGELKIETLAAGSYSYEVYYGTESCRLDTNSFKGEFTISAKEVQFELAKVEISQEQTCISNPNGLIVSKAKGWENDYNAFLITSLDGKTRNGQDTIRPVGEGDVTELQAALLRGGPHYFINVKDACGSEKNTDTITLPVLEPLALSIDTVTDSVTCARATDALIRFNVEGGVKNYHKAFVNEKEFDGTGTITYDNIGKGEYYVYYKSVDPQCNDSVGEYARIAGPDTLAIQYTLTGNCEGSKLIPEVSGESAPYTYTWSDGTEEINGTSEFPFQTEEGKTYSLTVSDAHACDRYTKSFTVPSAQELPSITQKVYGESEKCHNAKNGLMVIKPKLSSELDFAITATIAYGMIDSQDTIYTEIVLNPDGSFITPENLAPGKYFAITRLGSMDCDMGVDPIRNEVTVDSLQELRIASEFETKPMTCLIPNGKSKFLVDGWTYTHTANIYINDPTTRTYKSNVKPDSYYPGYVGDFNVDSLRGGSYTLIVKDKCNNSDTADFNVDQYIPSVKIDPSSIVDATCLKEPNGKLTFEVYGWTNQHQVNFNNGTENVYPKQRDGSIVVDTVDGQPRATISMFQLPSGLWTAKVINECGDKLDDKQEVKSIDPYKMELIADESKLVLDCPYDADGKITLKVSGGYSDATFSGFATTKVTYMGLTGDTKDSTFLVPDTSFSLVAVFDSLDMIINIDTTFKKKSQDTIKVDSIVIRYDTILVFDTIVATVEPYDTTIHVDTTFMYNSQDTFKVDAIVFLYDTIYSSDTIIPQKMDEEGNLVFDTIIRIDSVVVTEKVPIYGKMDSLSTSPISFTNFSPDPAGAITGQYKYLDLEAGTYRFTYKSNLEGCTDVTHYDTEVKKPAPVQLLREVMPISCSSSKDGVISLAPRRGGKSYSYLSAHDSTDKYDTNRLYKHETIDGKDTIVEYKEGDVALNHKIDQLYDTTDIKTISWLTYRDHDSKTWSAMGNIEFPDSTDYMEEVYYKGKDTIKTPVYSNTHLESFWHDRLGTYFESNVVTIANLAPGFYDVLVTDAKKCQYRDTFEVKLPEKPLKIDSIIFNPDDALCDPSKRQILAYVSGGWGEYNFTFSDTAKVKSLGEMSDGFRGGEATHYDKNTLSGWGVSQFLDPGLYTVVVLDEQGCMVKSDEKYSVNSKFRLHIDSTLTKCPEDPTADVKVVFSEKPYANETYTIVEYISSCRNDTLDDCREYKMDTLSKEIKPENGEFTIALGSLKMKSKTHGIFVYENNSKHCGTYVQGTVMDTIPIFKSSRKSVEPATCNGLNNGKIELYVSGGTEPYTVIRNSEWRKNDTLALFTKLKLQDTTFKLSLLDPSDTTKAPVDTFITNHYLTLDNMPADTFFFTVVDEKGCKSVMGDTASYDEKIIVKQPDTLKASFDASTACQEPSVTKGGNVFFKDVKGGTAPYIFSLSHILGGKEIEAFDNCDAIKAVDNGVSSSLFKMKVTDAHGCVVEGETKFRDDNLQVDTFDFWVTSWYDYGDVVALIDVCSPEQTFDSVSYVITNTRNNRPDSTVKMLDKRMYIYDLDGNPTQRDRLYQAKDTKKEVPNSFFRKNFKLRSDISEVQARHLNFFKVEDNSIDLRNEKSMKEFLSQHCINMNAFFLGCEYRLEKNYTSAMINPNNPQMDSIGQKFQIISLEGSPNPFADNVTITVRFTEKMAADLYIYRVDGTMINKNPIKIDPNDGSHWSVISGEHVFKRDFLTSELFSDNIDFDYIIVFVTTSRDQRSTILIHSPKILTE